MKAQPETAGQDCEKPLNVDSDKSLRAAHSIPIAAYGDPLNKLSQKLRARLSVAASGCWVWLGAKTSRGYGWILIKGRQGTTHRLAYELARGPIPAGMMVCHRCDNPPCCNPNHLFLGTGSDNQQDAKSKGRLFSQSPEFLARDLEKQKARLAEIERRSAAYAERIRRPTPRQQAILSFIQDYFREHWTPPTLRDIGAQFGIRSTNGVDDHLCSLEKKGYIARTGNGQSRGIRLLKLEHCPLCGTETGR